MKRKPPANAKVFEQNVIALVWDFDKTLIRDYMQAPLFRRYKVDSARFWAEVDALAEVYAKRGIACNRDTLYLNHLLTYIEHGPLKGLTTDDLFDVGKELEYYPGLPEFFPAIKKRIAENAEFARYGIKVEHYIVSTGFADTIRGSEIAKHVDGIWGCEFIEEPAMPGFLDGKKAPELPRQIRQIATSFDNTSKTRALFEISKGANKVSSIDVNSKMQEHDRRIPFDQMIYVADGPSDVPAFSILNQFSGQTFAIYPAGDQAAFHQVDKLRQDGRIDMFGPADYREGTQTWMWLVDHVEGIARRIAAAKEERMRQAVSAPPTHL